MRNKPKRDENGEIIRSSLPGYEDPQAFVHTSEQPPSIRIKHTPGTWRIKYWDSEHTRVTVEEISPDKYIATVWDKNHCYEVDRDVYEFETFGGAVDKAFDIMAAFLNEAEMQLLKQARHTASANRIGKKIREDLRSGRGRKLIAAAPELLARLEDCAHQLRQAWACIEHIKEHAPEYERRASIETIKAIQMVGNDAEAVIAKATGGDE